MKDTPAMLDTREIELPKTMCSHDIETRVIQIIILNKLHHIQGVSLLEGNLIDTLLGREVERVKGLAVEQDSKHHALKVKVEINMQYGVLIPAKVQEVQNALVEEITRLTGLHVASVHVVVKGLVTAEPQLQESFSHSLMIQDEEADLHMKEGSCV